MTEEEKEFFEEEYDAMYGEKHECECKNLLLELTRLRIELEGALESKANAVSEAYSEGHKAGLKEGWKDCDYGF